MPSAWHTFFYDLPTTPCLPVCCFHCFPVCCFLRSQFPLFPASCTGPSPVHFSCLEGLHSCVCAVCRTCGTCARGQESVNYLRAIGRGAYFTDTGLQIFRASCHPLTLTFLQARADLRSMNYKVIGFRERRSKPARFFRAATLLQ